MYIPVENQKLDLLNAFDEKMLQQAKFFIIKSYNEENVVQVKQFFFLS